MKDRERERERERERRARARERERERERERVTETEELAGRLDPSARSIRAGGSAGDCSSSCWTAGSPKLSRVYQKYYSD